MAVSKLRRLTAVSPREEIDSVRRARRHCGDGRAMNVLLQAQQAWNSMTRFRRERARNIRYAFGDQWGDSICVDGEYIKERDYIIKQGNVPLKNNLINRLVRNVVGVYRSQDKEPTCVARDRDEQQLGETMSTALQYVMQLNRMEEVYARSMMEYLLSGFVMHRKWYGVVNDRLDCWTEYVNPNNAFLDSNTTDFRGWDCTLIGMVHDVDFKTLCSTFAHSRKDYKRLRDIYSPESCTELYLAHTLREFGYDRPESYDFFLSPQTGLCRVIEVWKKESKPRWRCHDLNTGELFKCDESDKVALVDAENEQRLAMAARIGMSPDDVPLIEAEWIVDSYWYYYFLSPTGEILDEGETPYEHGSHPFVFKAYPFINGEIHSFVADIIDQQRYVNRLITLYDWIIRASAKGVLIFPEEQLSDDVSLDDVAEEWARFDGIIAIKGKPGVPLPQQISQNATNIGISELLNLQLKFFEDISGVNGALQGKPGYSSTSGTLYAQQTQNATTSLLDLLGSFSSFVVDAAYKDVKNIQQFYDSRRYLNVVGRRGVVMYDPEKIQDVEFDLSIVESTSSPAYRAMANDMLMQLLQQGQITLKQMLEVGKFEFADELLQSINAQQEAAQQGQSPEGLSPELAARAAAGSNPQQMAAAQQMLQQNGVS